MKNLIGQESNMEISLEQHKQSLGGESEGTEIVFSPGNAEEVNMKNLEIASYLGLKESIFDPEIMDKVSTLSEYFDTLEDMKEIDFKLGNPAEGDRLQKLLVYTMLNKEENEYRRKVDLIEQQKNKLYE